MESHILLDAGLKQGQFKVVQGMYKGQAETSYVVDADFKHIVFKLAYEYNQESILYIDETREASLIHLDHTCVPKREKLGKFKAVQNVKGYDAYTVDPTTGYCYIVEAT